MTYFKNCTTLDEVKKTYRELCKKNHPDLGGNLETMQAINSEYAFACAKIARGENLSQEETENTILNAEKYREVLEKLIVVEGIVIELVGTWIWVTGSTYPVKDKLKAAGLYFASKKLAWYFRSEENKVTNYGKKMELQQIRTKYGSQKIGGNFTTKKYLFN